MNNKFTFNIENVSLTIEGQPVQLGGINIEINSEASVHEIAAYGGMFKDLVNQIKDMVNHIPRTPSTPYPTAPAPVVNIGKRVEPAPSPSPASTVNVAVESKPAEAAPAEKSLDIKATFDSLEKNLTKRGWSSDKLGNLHWKALTNDKKFEYSDITIDSAIRLHCMRRSEDLNSNVHMHIYPNQVYVSGISPYYIERFLKGSDIPGLEYIWPIVKDMEARA